MEGLAKGEDMSERDLIIFSHGMMSRPTGTKIQRLSTICEELGWAHMAIDYTATMDPDERVQMLLDKAPQGVGRMVLVGSSMGAYVSTVASSTLRPQGLFLLAPAVGMPSGYAHQHPTPHTDQLEIIHGWRDEVIPYSQAIAFAEAHKGTLHLVDGDHRLMDPLPLIERWFRIFLSGLG